MFFGDFRFFSIALAGIGLAASAPAVASEVSGQDRGSSSGTITISVSVRATSSESESAVPSNRLGSECLRLNADKGSRSTYRAPMKLSAAIQSCVRTGQMLASAPTKAKGTRHAIVKPL